MGTLLFIFWCLLSLVSSYVLPSVPRDPCKELGPEIYCASKKQMEKCEKLEFCNNYLRKPICKRGPEAYCKTKQRAKFCNKIEYCLTWPNDYVVARKIPFNDHQFIDLAPDMRTFYLMRLKRNKYTRR